MSIIHLFCVNYPIFTVSVSSSLKIRYETEYIIETDRQSKLREREGERKKDVRSVDGSAAHTQRRAKYCSPHVSGSEPRINMNT